jgi:hypothetical protein
MRKAEPMRILVAFGALSQVGGEAFEDSGANRSSIARVWHLLAGGIAMTKGNPREVDAAVRRIGDRLLLIECFSYELPLDYEGKPSVYDSQDGNLAS